MSDLTPLEASILEGTSKATVKKITDAGITTVEDLSRQNPKLLAKQTGMEETRARVKTRFSDP